MGRWRRALGATRKNNPGTHRLILGAIAAALELRFEPGTSGGAHATVWSAAEVALLGTAPDAEVARKLGRSRAAINGKRKAAQASRRRRAGDALGPVRKFWTADEVAALLGVVPDAEVSGRIGRGISTGSEKRRKLGLAAVVPGPRGQHGYLWSRGGRRDPARRYSPAEAARRLNRSLSAIYPHRRAAGHRREAEARGLRSRSNDRPRARRSGD